MDHVALAFLNDQFYKRPDYAKHVMRNLGHQIRLIMLRCSLFVGGNPTGNSLKASFSDALLNTIQFDEICPFGGATGLCRFTPNLWHMRKSIEIERPYVIICIGQVALKGYRQLEEFHSIPMLQCPHPTEFDGLTGQLEMDCCAKTYESLLNEAGFVYE